MPVQNHTHKYQRFYQSEDKRNSAIFRCMLVNCSHFLRLIFIVNKESICWKCDKKFVIGPKEALMKKPTCGCSRKTGSKAKEGIERREEDNSLDDILKKIAGANL